MDIRDTSVCVDYRGMKVRNIVEFLRESTDNILIRGSNDLYTCYHRSELLQNWNGILPYYKEEISEVSLSDLMNSEFRVYETVVAGKVEGKTIFKLIGFTT
jgi:hypothetical protein